MSDTSTMEGDLPVEYYTEAGRLESFQIAHPLPKHRDSTTKGRGAKPAKWPHSWLEPKSLAEAGFIYMPEPGNLDNVMCFLCRRSICGWTDGDEPLAEHLKLSPDCGWAITSCIEAKVGDIHLENPMSTRMVEARKATFGDRWPHDSKKGWKCKTKQLVEAGWIYKPTYDGDDFAECIYCTLALDGWEPADKPFHEHHARSPECAFFELCNRPESPIAKKTTTKRKPRTSKVANTRLSMQSTLEPEPSYLEAPSFANETVQDEGDSIATTTSTIMPKGRGRPKAAAKGRKKKVATPEVSDHEMEVASEAEVAPPPKTKRGRAKKVKEEPAPPVPEHNETAESAVSQTLIVGPSAPKSRRGKKRLSDESEHDESIVAPAPKRRTRNSVALQDSINLMPAESSLNTTVDEMSASTPPKKATATKKKAGRPSRSRKMSVTSDQMDIGDDQGDERLDQQLEDALDRQLEDMDVENPRHAISPENLNPPPANAPLPRKLRNSRSGNESHHEMFSEMEVDEDAIEAELRRMAEEEQISKPLPKKGKGVKVERKVSVKQQVAEEKRRRKAAEAEAAAEAERLRAQQQAEEEEEEQRRVEAEAEAEAEAEKLRLQQEEEEEAERLRLEEEEEERRRQAEAKAMAWAKAQAEAEEQERVHQAQLLAEQRRREEAEQAEQDRLEAEAEAEEERRIKEEEEEAERVRLEEEEEEAERLRLEEEEEEAERLRLEEEEELRLQAEAEARQEKHRKAEAVKVAKATKAKGKAKAKAKSPSPEPEPSPARSPTPAESSPVRSPSPVAQSTPVQPLSAVSARSAISTRSQRTIKTLSPSASPQSSDAENHPPSSRPSSSVQPSSAATARQPLGATTPKTPSRSLNVGGAKSGGLKSDQPWSEVDLDTIFAHMRSPDKENAEVERDIAAMGELSDEERGMTVEEWIRHNAINAEGRLKRECEAMVSLFEREGARAMRCLEGVEAIDG